MSLINAIKPTKTTPRTPLSPVTKKLILRLFIFFVLFGLISGIIGPWVIRTRLLYGFNFYIYGNMGKVLLIGVLAFIFLAKDKLQHIQLSPYKKNNVSFLIMSALLVAVFFPTATELLKYPSWNSNIFLALFCHLILMLSVVSLTLGVFTPVFIKTFVREFKKELAICLALATFLYFMIFQVWKLWPIFSDVVLQMTYFAFRLFYPQVYVVLPRTLSVQGFSVEIAQACSGVDSLFLFTVLYWFFGLVDWKTFNKKKLVGMFVPAVAGLFLVNVLRIFLLILLGVVWSRELALSLFHTYAGLVLFLVYFVVFWRVFGGWMRR